MTKGVLIKVREALEEIGILALCLKSGGLATDNDRDTWADDIIKLSKEALQQAEQDREAVRGLADELEEIQYIHADNQPMARNMDALEYAKSRISLINGKARKARETHREAIERNK